MDPRGLSCVVSLQSSPMSFSYYDSPNNIFFNIQWCQLQRLVFFFTTSTMSSSSSTLWQLPEHKRKEKSRSHGPISKTRQVSKQLSKECCIIWWLCCCMSEGTCEFWTVVGWKLLFTLPGKLLLVRTTGCVNPVSFPRNLVHSLLPGYGV